MGTPLKVAKTADIPPGTGKSVDTAGQAIAVFNVGGQYFAIENDCKHRGGPLGDGELDGTTVTCPLHAWTYDVTTGECFDDPACGVARYPVTIDGDDILVEV